MKTQSWMVVALGLAAPGLARAVDRPGVEARAQGGLVAFPGAAHGFLNPGFSYGAGMSVEGPQLVGVEVNYQGAAYATKANAEAQESIVESGGEALLKLGPKTRTFDAYALGGYGLSFLNVAERVSPEASPVQDDWVTKIPVGLGVTVKVPAPGGSDVVVGARSSYDFLFNNKAYDGLGGSYTTDKANSGRSGDQINTQLTLGGKF